MGRDNTDCDDMPERIWLDPRSYNGAVGFAHPEKHKQDGWPGYLRSDLCTSGQQVRALEARPWVVFDAVFRFLKDDAKTQEVFDAITSALTPVPQAEANENYADPVSSARQPEGEVMDNPALVEALREVSQALAWQCFGECRGFSENLKSPSEALSLARTALASHEAPQAATPTAQEAVAEAATHALDACRIIDAAVLEGHDNTSDLILHLLEAVEPARAALRAMKGGK